jgi:2-iminobutanoate/2-iminopropanoate deaminase
MERKAIGRRTEAGFSTSAVSGAGFVFTNGSIGADPTTGELPDDLETQTRNTLDRLHKILRDADSSLSKVVKVNVYLDDIESDFDLMNDVYRQYFAEHGIDEPPARTTIGCRLPWSKVEMDLVALA